MKFIISNNKFDSNDFHIFKISIFLICAKDKEKALSDFGLTMDDADHCLQLHPNEYLSFRLSGFRSLIYDYTAGFIAKNLKKSVIFAAMLDSHTYKWICEDAKKNVGERGMV